MKTIAEILKTPPADRDRSWENQFFFQLTNAKVELLSEGPITGPDGWPYLLVNTIENPSTEATAGEPVQKILRWLADKGVGLVVNPEQEYPDYVFPYGMIWHFRESGLFFRDQTDIPTGTVVLETGANLKAGPPTESFLPKDVRKILKDFFRDQGLFAVRILVLQTESNFYDLAFSLDSLGKPPASEHAGLAEAIAWFLPPHYSILLTEEKNLPPFVEL